MKALGGRWLPAIRAPLVVAFVLAVLPFNRVLALNEAAHQAVIHLVALQLDEPARNTLESWFGPQWQDDLVFMVGQAGRVRPHPLARKVLFEEEAHSFDPLENCPGNQCVVAPILESIKVLESDSFDMATKQKAFRYLMHFTIELHVPVNAGRAADRGGLDLTLTTSGLTDVTLDSVWNEDLYSRITDSAFVQAQRYRRRLPDLPVTEWQQSLDPVEWALETHQVALETAYAFAERGEYDAAYRRVAFPVLESQMIKASVRLAHLANSLL